MDAEHEKDLRRRGAELDMAHKSHDRAKGHAHSRTARSTCSVCNGFRASRRAAPNSDKSELEKATHRGRGAVWAQFDTEDAMYAPPHELEEDAEGTDDAGSVRGALARVVFVHREHKRKGVAADYEIVPSVAHGVLVLDDDANAVLDARVPEPREEWQYVDSDGDSVGSVPGRSYASAAQRASA